MEANGLLSRRNHVESNKIRGNIVRRTAVRTKD